MTNPISLDELCRDRHVLVATDDIFQRKARLLQALWRESRQFPIGERSPGIPLGSRLPLKFATESFANIMTDEARCAAREELDASADGDGKLIEERRLLSNLLSSQPLCFNLFAELKADLALASRVFRELFPSRVAEVSAVRFEHSPGRSDFRYTGDRSAFDVFVEHVSPAGKRGFIGVEVKYHEGLDDPPAAHRPRYDELAEAMGCFDRAHSAALRRKPLQQIWRDHLLAGSMLTRKEDGWKMGLSVFLHPAGNARCVAAAAQYERCLTDQQTFTALTLESLIGVLRRNASGSWVADVEDRYFGWAKIDHLLRGQSVNSAP